MLDELIGGIRFGMSEAEVEQVLGAPTKRGRARSAGEAIGGYEKTWSWTGGIKVTFYSDLARQGPYRAFVIELVAPSPLATQRGIGIGASRAEVEQAYADVKSAADSRADLFVAGAVHGGVQFELRRGKVTSIFVGVGAF